MMLARARLYSQVSESQDCPQTCFVAESLHHNYLYTASGCSAMLQDSLDSCALVTPTAGFTIPLMFAPHARTSERFFEFFTVNIRNRNTRQAYYHAVSLFSRWCEARGILDLTTVRPLHVAAYIEHRLTMAIGQNFSSGRAAAHRGPPFEHVRERYRRRPVG